MHRPILLVPSIATLLLAGGCGMAPETARPGPAPLQVEALDPAVATVYPALVQILVVARDLIAAYDPGASSVRLTVCRAAGEESISLALPVRPRTADEQPVRRDQRLECSYRDCAADDRERLGWPAGLAGALITEADAGGWAAVSGLRSDDLVITLDGAVITSGADLARLLAVMPPSQRRSAISVRRGAGTLILEIEWPAGR